MTEAMIVEAIRAAGGGNAGAVGAVQAAPQAMDPQAVEAFERAMGAEAATPVPMASQISETWRAAQDGQQGLLHRMTALADVAQLKQASVAQLTMLQYEVASFSFHQEIVTNIAKKATDAISTLVKNS